MKHCAKCNTNKPLEEFSKNKTRKDGKMSSCKDCMKEYKQVHYNQNSSKVYESVRLRRQKIKDLVWEYKSTHSCVDCSLIDPVVMEFDHLSDKESDVSKMVIRGLSWERIQKEIAKCEMVCANCHRRRTHSRGEWVRNRINSVDVTQLVEC